MVDSPRLKEFDYSSLGMSYFVTLRFKVPISESFRENLMSKMLPVFDESDFLCDAVVVMPDHLHIVTTKIVESGSRLSDLMCMLKSKTIHLLKKEEVVIGTFWQRGYYDHVIRNEADWIEKMRYVLGNSVKAGLVEPYPHVYCRFSKVGATQGRPLRGLKRSRDE